MGINYAVSNFGDADGLAGETIDQRTLDLSEALEMLINLTHDMGANISVEITHVDETKVVIYYTYYIGAVPASGPGRWPNSNDYGYYYLFEKNPHDDLDTFDKFVFAVTCVVKTVPWICSQRVLRRVIAGDKLAYQPA